MNETELLLEMRAMLDAVLNAGFGYDSLDEVEDHQWHDVMSAWRQEIAEHPESAAMEAKVEEVMKMMGDL